jgi:hypothetical protein
MKPINAASCSVAHPSLNLDTIGGGAYYFNSLGAHGGEDWIYQFGVS